MKSVMSDEMVKECIDACTKCANVCQETIDYCLKQGGDHVAESHIKLLLDCAEICRVCDDFLLRRSQQATGVCRVCAEVCDACATSCSSFKGDSQMEKCAEMCTKCAESCREMSA